MGDKLTGGLYALAETEDSWMEQILHGLPVARLRPSLRPDCRLSSSVDRLSRNLCRGRRGGLSGWFDVGEALALNAEWVRFLASSGAVVLTFLAGAELDPDA